MTQKKQLLMKSAFLLGLQCDKLLWMYQNQRDLIPEVDEADASTLYRIAFSHAPSHCPDCAACYCGKHWKWRCFTDGPHSGVEGHCPSGHFHVHSC